MRRGSYALIGLVAVAGMAAAAWILVGPHLRRETVTIVSLLPRTGSAKPQTDAIVLGIRLALDEHDHRAGRFRVKHEDWDYSVAAGGLNSTGATLDRLTRQAKGRPDILAVLGAYESASTYRILQAHLVDEVPFVTISPGSTRGDLTDYPQRDGGLGGEFHPGRYFFRTLPAQPMQGTLAARWAKRQGMKRVHHYRSDRDHDLELLSAFRKEAELEGLTVTESAEGYPSEMARNQARERPDLVFLSGNDPQVAADVVGYLRLAGYRGKILLGSGSLEPLFLKELGNGAEVYLTSLDAPPPPDFVRRAGISNPHAYYGYLAAKAALQAISQADSKDRLQVIRACGRLPIFDSEGELAQPEVGLHRVVNGRFELVEVLK